MVIVFQRPLLPAVPRFYRGRAGAPSRELILSSRRSARMRRRGPIERADTIIRRPLEQGPGPTVWMQGVEAMQQESEGSSPMLVREGPPSWRDCV